MKNGYAHYLLDFIVIVLGISVSYFLNDQKTEHEKSEKEQVILSSLLSDIEVMEAYIHSRQQTLKSDSLWMDYLVTHWDRVNQDSMVNEFTKTRFHASFHNLFLDIREFHLPIASFQMVIQDGSLNLISNTEVKRLINTVVFLSKEQLLNNVQQEMDLQLAFQDRLMQDGDPELISMLSVTHEELEDRFAGSLDYTDQSRDEIRVILSKPYAKNYLSLKFRHRYFVNNFLRRFAAEVRDLKGLIRAEIDGRG